MDRIHGPRAIPRAFFRARRKPRDPRGVNASWGVDSGPRFSKLFGVMRRPSALQPPSYRLEPLASREFLSAAAAPAAQVQSELEPLRRGRRRTQPPTATFAVIGDYGFHTGDGI